MWFEILYSDYTKGELYDIRVRDEQDSRSTSYSLKIPRSGPIPTLLVRSSERANVDQTSTFESLLTGRIDKVSIDILRAWGILGPANEMKEPQVILRLPDGN